MLKKAFYTTFYGHSREAVTSPNPGPVSLLGSDFPPTRKAKLNNCMFPDADYVVLNEDLSVSVRCLQFPDDAPINVVLDYMHEVMYGLWPLYGRNHPPAEQAYKAFWDWFWDGFKLYDEADRKEVERLVHLYVMISINPHARKANHLSREQRDKRERRFEMLRKRNELVPILREAAKNVCAICEQELPWDNSVHVDHIIPVSEGGPDDMWNLRLVHRQCNLRRNYKGE